MILIDSNILLDIWQNDPIWASKSAAILGRLAPVEELAINSIIYAEVSVRFSLRSDVDRALSSAGITILNTPNEAAFQAGKVSSSIAGRVGQRPAFCRTSLSVRMRLCLEHRC